MPSKTRKSSAGKSATSRAKRAVTNGAADGLSDAKVAADKAVPVVKKAVSSAVYVTAYSVAYSVSFSSTFLGHLLPRSGSVGVGITEGRLEGRAQADRIASVFIKDRKSRADDHMNSIVERIATRREKKKRDAAVRVAAARAKGETFLTAANISHDALLTD